MSDISFLNYHFANKVRFWRMLAFAVIIIGLISLFKGADVLNKHSSYIAEIEINDMIIDASEQEKEILKLQNDKSIKAVIVAINSPGGTTYDSEILYNALQKVSTKKPVVSYMKNVAASGGYIVALASEHIIASSNTITGSIGVLMQVPNVKKLLDNIGVTFQEIKSSPIKGEPDFYSDTPPEAIDNLKSMLDDTDLWFKNLVKLRRPKMTSDVFIKVTDGSVYTGRQAVKLGLVDQIGGQPEARSYLQRKYKLESDLEIKKVTINPLENNMLVDEFLDTLLPESIKNMINNFTRQTNHVDGLLSVWHS